MSPVLLFAVVCLLMPNYSVQTDDNKRLVMDNGEVDLFQEIIHLKQEFADFKKNVSDSETNLTRQLNQLKNENAQLLKGTGGAVYVRWGRNVCPNIAETIYKGKHYNQRGSGTNYLCLPDDPTWSHYVDGDDTWRGYVYGTELEIHDAEHIFDKPVHNEDIPCAVCQPRGSVTMMIPGRNNCYGNWTMEYQGYLMAAGNGYSATPYICVDQQPEFIPGGAASNDEAILYLIEGICGSLQCPPYVEGRELACVVCTK